METPQLKLMTRAMQAYSWRMQAVASNLANLDTPGYQRVSVTFEDTLQDVRHRVPSLQQETDVEPRMNVEDAAPVLEDELMDLADTQMRVQLTSRALHEHFGMMRMGITGRTA